MASSLIDVDLTHDSSDDGNGFDPGSVCVVVPIDNSRSRYHEDRQFWRWRESNCAVATYATVMEFALSHMKMLEIVPDASYLGKVFNARSSLKVIKHPLALKHLHAHAIRSSAPDCKTLLSFSRVVEMYPVHVGLPSGELKSLMKAHVTTPVVTGDYGRPVRQHNPAKVIGENGDAATSIAAYLHRCRGPPPAILQVDVSPNGILPCVLPPMTLRVFDATHGGFTGRCVEYHFCALVAGNKKHYKAVLQCPEGLMWSYDSLGTSGTPPGHLVPRQFHTRV